MPFEMKVQMEGLQEALRKMKKLSTEALHEELRPVARQASQMLLDESRTRAPVDKGFLKSDIEILNADVGNRGMVVRVGVRYGSGKANHAHLQEFGTSFHGAQPFFRPAMDSKRQAIIELFKKAAENAVKK